jgi:peptidoglycan/LPS O-acetylase OafA/YrhL
MALETTPRTTATTRTPSPPKANTLAYSPALDGLRAVAVVAVLLYHLSVPWVRGGFLGVDLFFVLSGFLITSLLIREYQARGSIHLGRFWARRVRRLLPAALLVIAAVCIWSALSAPSDRIWSVRHDALWTLGYAARISTRTPPNWPTRRRRAPAGRPRPPPSRGVWPPCPPGTPTWSTPA